MTVKEFIQMVNEGEFWCLEAIDDSDLGEGFERIESGNNLDGHRWYSTAEDVYKLEDGYVGVRGLFQIFSEWGYAKDYGVKCEAYEVERVQSVKYIKKEMKSFNVIINDFNRGTFEPYNIMPYLVNEYNKASVKPSSFQEFKEFVKQRAQYQWWSRCEYEIILVDWPNQKVSEKWDVYRQVMMNINIVVKILMENINGNTES